MEHDGFLGSFHSLATAWPYPDCPMPFDTLHHAAMDAGLDGSVLSSLVLSPSSLPAAAATGNGVAGYGSCYSKAASSPTKKQVPTQLAADPVLAARLSCLAAAAAAAGGRLLRVASSQSVLAEPPPPPPASPGGAQLASSHASCTDGHCRKRKAGAKTKTKEAAATASTKASAKKYKLYTDVEEGGKRDDEMKATAALASKAGQGKGKEGNAKNCEPPKDYIHVRARRGQATDSHSLAERVRREKISERMKLLQDLVPGCSKVTGKAVMLDEIINYVQSLQRQVEFLSMKLATVNLWLDFNVDNFLLKDVHRSNGSVPPVPPPPAYLLESSISAFSYAAQSQGTAMHIVVTNGTGMGTPHASFGVPHPHLDGFQCANSKFQVGNVWEDDLQSVVQMGFRGSP